MERRFAFLSEDVTASEDMPRASTASIVHHAVLAFHRPPASTRQSRLAESLDQIRVVYRSYPRCALADVRIEPRWCERNSPLECILRFVCATKLTECRCKPAVDRWNRSPQIALQTGPIVFGGGVPVGGWSNLTLSPDGTFDFTGHFHNSGFVGFDASVGWVLKSATGTAFTWAAGGGMGGLGGDRDFNWNNAGKNAAIADAWDDLSAGCSWAWRAQAGIDFLNIIKELESVVGTIVQVIAVVGPLLARPPRPR